MSHCSCASLSNDFKWDLCSCLFLHDLGYLSTLQTNDSRKMNLNCYPHSVAEGLIYVLLMSINIWLFKKSDNFSSVIIPHLGPNVSRWLCDLPVQRHTKWKLSSTKYYLFSVCQLSPPTGDFHKIKQRRGWRSEERGTRLHDATGGHTTLSGPINAFQQFVRVNNVHGELWFL